MCRIIRSRRNTIHKQWQDAFLPLSTRRSWLTAPNINSSLLKLKRMLLLLLFAKFHLRDVRARVEEETARQRAIKAGSSSNRSSISPSHSSPDIRKLPMPDGGSESSAPNTPHRMHASQQGGAFGGMEAPGTPMEERSERSQNDRSQK